MRIMKYNIFFMKLHYSKIAFMKNINIKKVLSNSFSILSLLRNQNNFIKIDNILFVIFVIIWNI